MLAIIVYLFNDRYIFVIYLVPFIDVLIFEFYIK